MHNFLEQIKLKINERLESKPDLPFNDRVPHNFLEVFNSEVAQKTSDVSLSVIPEIKFASPSVCHFDHDDALALANAYVDAGAKAISIVTEPYFFAGTYQSVVTIRTCLPDLYILMKDFIITEQQLFEARGIGADAVLLIAAFLTPERLQDLYQVAIEIGLTPLVEVHTEAELQMVEALDVNLIGVNNRDLKSLQVKPETARNLITQRKSKATFIALSGISNAQTLRQLAQQGYQGVVLGSYLLHSKNPGTTLAQLLSEVSHHAS